MNKLVASSVLTLGVLFSFVFFLVILALQSAEVLNLPTAIGLTVGINVVLFFLGPVISDWVNRRFYKVRFYSESEVRSSMPAVAEVIDKVTAKHGFKFPRIGIIPDQNPTAFTYGTFRSNARVILTEGIFKFLTPGEVKAVVAHEMGHIVHYDFLVMMVASTIIQILYEIYYSFSRAKGKKSGNLKMIALIAYIMYLIGIYLVLFLSRVREYFADRFAAEITSPHDLANALIKIAYGIIAVEDSDRTTRLLESTRHLGILDVKNAKHVGMLSYATQNKPELLSEVMVFDFVSPWAVVSELSSTHPLTGKRIEHLGQLARAAGKPFGYDVPGAAKRLGVAMDRIYAGFTIGLLFYFLPHISVIISLLVFPLPLLPAVIGVALLIVVLYKYPLSKPQEISTVLDEMRDPYLTPIRGKPIRLNGGIIGKGIPGYVFSEDLMFRDATGLLFLDYTSLFGWLGNLFFSLKKVKELIGKEVAVTGWLYRGVGTHLRLAEMTPDGGAKISSHPAFADTFVAIILIVVGLAFWVYNGGGFLPVWATLFQ